MDPSDCGLKLRNCCMKSEHSMSATSAFFMLAVERDNKEEKEGRELKVT
jgi:hypothetical protein